MDSNAPYPPIVGPGVHVFAALFVTAPRPAPVPVPTPAPDTHVGTMAWLLPIMLGLLLTAVACYKHRGLPGGH